MTKQIKLGFDKGVTRSIETDQVLVDIRGNLLRDDAGNFLYTKTNIELPGFFAAKKATSIVINNDDGVSVFPGGPLAIEEQFPETSAVALSLLGVPRRNVQQSLLADVSIYGLDPSIWEFYDNSQPYAPAEWNRRRNNTHGSRFFPRLSEKPDQQALAIEAFPVPWTFPFGPQFADQGGRYNEQLFPLYSRFIQMGNELYSFYNSLADNTPDVGEASRLRGFAEKYFLPRIDSNRIDGGGANVAPGGLDVEYNEDFQTAMDHIERWTITWMDIRDGRLEDPRQGLPSSLRVLTFARISSAGILNATYTLSNTRPGYRSDSYYYAQMQSKEAFRYQPGAISGFTFGVKVNFDETSLNNKIEWGCANDTDQYMFQVAGSRFNIVRRSTVPLTATALGQNNIPIEPVEPTISPNPFERPGAGNLTGSIDPINDLPRYETVISQDQFNGDGLDGNGLSGYNISFQEVTMYKIEYSWYGAIGAKFYAYIPVGHGECRWVLLHTFIIENTLPSPSLRNPYLHFRYSMVITETSSLREPIFIYKYGASYYIDGSDESNFTYATYSTLPKDVINTESKPIIGFQTKDYIQNRDGISIPNQKNFYIDRITATADKNVRVDILECEGCRDGFGHFYSTSLVNGQRAATSDFYLRNGSTVVYADPEVEFTLADTGKKIIASGINSTYIYPDQQNLSTATIRRRMGTTAINNNPVTANFSQTATSFINGETVSLNNNTENGLLFTGKLYGFDDIAASSIPLFKENIDIRFLNPVSREPTSHFREFRIGVTSKQPEIDLEGNLVFDGNALDQSEEMYVEFAQFQTQKNINGVEIGEFEVRTGFVMADDVRLPIPRGSFSGVCSTLNIKVDTSEVSVTYSSTHPETGDPGNFLIFEEEPTISLTGGEMGIKDANGNKFVPAQSGGLSITFLSEIETYTNQLTEEVTLFAEISAPLLSIPDGVIAFRSITLSGRHVRKQSIQKFNLFPLYLFVSMHDNARVHNIVVKEYGNTVSDTLSHTPIWLIGNDSNIEAVDAGNPLPGSGITDVVGTNEYIGRDGIFFMGGTSTQGNPPANFSDKFYLNSTLFDTQTIQPLRPGVLKYTFFIGANETTEADMTHIFGIDRYKITKGSLNNATVYINSRVLDTGQSGTVDLSILGKEQ